MHTNERFDTILDHLKRHKRATVADLSKLMFVSGATVRRDLTEMQKLGLLQRTHGGAMYSDGAEEVSIFVRQEANAVSKGAVAFVALAHLPDFQTIFIDNSSTCLALAARMSLPHKVVVTNGLEVASLLAQRDDVQIIMPGGRFSPNRSFSGSMTCNALRGFRFDVMLSSCAAMDLDGSYESSLSSMELKATALELSHCHVLLVDHTKLQSSAPYRTAPLGAYDYIFTDAGDEQLAPFRSAGIHLINQSRILRNPPIIF